MESESGIHIGREIRDEMERQGRKPEWLAQRLSFDKSNVYKIFKKATLDVELLRRISMVLERDFFKIYSESMGKEM
jgi:hypothetical protein